MFMTGNGLADADEVRGNMFYIMTRWFPWIIVSGAATLLVGLAWDDWLQRVVPDLAVR